jgi:plasmid stability protein
MVREAVMPSLTIRDIPEELHARLKADAVAHGRSLNKEILLRLAVSVIRRQPSVDEVVDRLRAGKQNR